MVWQDPAIRQLCVEPSCGYRTNGRIAAEPTALACLALAQWDRPDPAHAAAAWLAAHQSPDGSVGVWEQPILPSWPTALAVLAWRALDDRSVREGRAPIYADNIERAIRHILSLASRVLDDTSVVGHNDRTGRCNAHYIAAQRRITMNHRVCDNSTASAAVRPGERCPGANEPKQLSRPLAG